MRKRYAVIVMIVLCMAIVAGCGKKTSNSPSPTAGRSTAGGGSSTSSSSKSASNEKPLPPETHPVGDIPDSQVFVTYKNTKAGYLFDAPEGWARTEKGSNVSFVHNFDGVSVNEYAQKQAPTVNSVQSNQVKSLIKTGRAIKILGIKDVTLKNEKAILVKYNSNSKPNKVTNKQVRLENERFYYFKNGKLAELTLWAPLGADNVDQWKRISDSFRWSK